MKILNESVAHGAVGVLALGGLLFCAPSPALAAYASCDGNAGASVHTMGGVFNAQVVVNAANSSGACASSPGVDLNGEVRVTQPTALGPATHRFGQVGSARAAGQAQVGRLGASVVAAASSSPEAYFFTLPDLVTTAATDNNYQATANGSVYAQFGDTLTVKQAPGASPQAPVDVRFTLALSGGKSVSGQGGASAEASLRITQTIGVGGGLLLSDTGAQSTVLSLYPFTPSTPWLVTLFGDLRVFASAAAGRSLGCNVPNIWCTTNPAEFGDYYAESQVVASYGSTAAFYIEVLTPGASFTSESGAAYQNAAVPLPAAAWLFVSGLLGLLRVRPRRNRSSLEA